jgi:DNA helicase HerA-like ATPase
VSDVRTRLQEAYAVKGESIEVGRAVVDGQVAADTVVRFPLKTANRHGLVAGATGTGKTTTLRTLAEQLSAAGVAVFATDVKGDLSGLAAKGDRGSWTEQAVTSMGETFEPEAFPVEYYSLGGLGPGVPIRVALSDFGPLLLAKVLDANKTQEQSLALLFHYADEKQLPLVDLVDVRSMLQFLDTKEGRQELKGIGGVSPATVGVLLRALVQLEEGGGNELFGEPQLDINDLIRTDETGRGVISLLELSDVRDKPLLWSTATMWLLAELFESLPEVGDLPKPKLVFFFDEAHLLFKDASKAFLEAVVGTARLIRSKGVGVFFVTQTPKDVDKDVLAQLGSRVQHALRAHTPDDAKALRAAVRTYPKSEDYDLEQLLPQLAIGEAVVTVLDERGVPTPVAHTRVRPPRSRLEPMGNVAQAAQASSLYAKYGTRIDKESARELLAERLARAREPEAEPAPKPRSTPKPRPRPKGDDDGAIGDFLKSTEGRAIRREVMRTLFGLLRKKL